MRDINDDFNFAISLICNAEKKIKDPENEDFDSFFTEISGKGKMEEAAKVVPGTAASVIQVPVENTDQDTQAFEDIETVLNRELGKIQPPPDEPIKAKSPTELEIPEQKTITSPLERIEIEPSEISKQTKETSTSSPQHMFSPEEIADIIFSAHDPVVLQCTARLSKPYSQAGDMRLLLELERPKNENPTPAEVEKSKGISTSLNYLRRVVKMVLKKKYTEYSETNPTIVPILDMLITLDSKAQVGEKYAFVDKIINVLIRKSEGAKSQQIHDDILKEKDTGLNIAESAETSKLDVLNKLMESNTSETIPADSAAGRFLTSISQMPSEKNRLIEMEFPSDNYTIKVKITPGPKLAKGITSIFIDTNILPEALMKHMSATGITLAPEQLQSIGKKFVITKNPDGSFKKDVKETIKLLKKMNHPGADFLENLYTKSAFNKAMLVIRGNNV